MSTKTVSDKVPSDGIAVQSDGSPDEVKPPDVRRTVYCPEYVIKPGDEVLKLAKRYSFRIPDFRAVNPAVDENHVRVGQKVKIPGFFDEGKLGSSGIGVGRFMPPPERLALCLWPLERYCWAMGSVYWNRTA